MKRHPLHPCKRKNRPGFIYIYREAIMLNKGSWQAAGPTPQLPARAPRYTEMTVVSLICCKVKLDRISTTAGCCISLSMAKRENSVRSFTCTRSK